MKLTFEGGRELAQALRKLPAVVAAEILETAVVAGATIVQADATRRAPRPAERRRPKTMRLADSIKVFITEKDRAHTVVDVGSRVPYAHLVEYGHQIVARGPSRQGLSRSRKKDTIEQSSLRRRLRTELLSRRAGGSLGVVAPRPFLRPAFDENKERIIKRIGEVLGAGIENEFSRHVKAA